MIIPVSGGKLFAVIAVTYPAGSTCTCANGTKTYTAKDTSGRWIFRIPSAGTWTVTISNGTDTKSESVSITAAGQAEKVTLAFNLYILKNGSYGDYDFSGYQGRAVTFTGGEIVTTSTEQTTSPFCFKTGINIDDWSTLVFKVKNTDLSSGYPFAFGVKNTAAMVTNYEQRNYAAETKLTAISNEYREISVDVSELKGTYFVHGNGIGHTWTSEIYFK